MGEISEKDFEQIERFLLGRMSPEESSAFEGEINENPELKASVDEIRLAINSVEAEGLKRDLDSIHGELYGKGSSGGNRFLIWSMAASFAVLIGFAFWFFQGSISSERLYSEYAYKDPGLPVPMSASDTYEFHDAMVDYKTENYASAIAKWKKLYSEEPDNDTLRYYIGAAYFNSDSLAQAELYLTGIADSDSPFKYKAQYTVLLILLKSGKEEAILRYEISESSPFKERVESLKEEIRS